ncbi:hypothetical protein P8452_73378 [Trifolium repens]|nr:hypothetical protein P8452_73378 [Trifolium repens]
MEDISQAPQESKEPSKEIAKKEKVGSTKEKQRRGKVLKPIKEIAEKEKVGSTKKKQRRGKVLKPTKEIAKKEKVGSRKKKLPIKTTTPEELCAFYTPQELYEKYTSDQLRQKFGLPKLHEILPRNLLALMVFPRPVFRYLDGDLIELKKSSC